MTLLRNRRGDAFCDSLFFRIVTQILRDLRVCLVLGTFTTSVDVISDVLVLTFSSLFDGLVFFSPVRLKTQRNNLTLTISNLRLANTLNMCANLVAQVHRLM